MGPDQEDWATKPYKPIMFMFMGQFEHNIDDKGRLAIPKKFREAFSEGLVITQGFDPCLWVFTLRGWDNFTNKISKLPLANADARATVRAVYAGALDCQQDQQGRVIVPNYLRQYASLETSVVILGVNDRLEIWDKDSWEHEKEIQQVQGSQMAERLSSLGIL